MRILLVSTYELGHQPLHLASPATALRACGHEIKTLDTSLDPWDDAMIGWAEAVAVSVPMHTAMRLALRVLELVRGQREGLPVAFYGLYAGMAGAEADVAVLVGEYEAALVAWAAALPHVGRVTDLTVQSFGLPDRSTLPGLNRYAHLRIGDSHRVVGYVEASHGCRHRCTHCPIPAVYDGTFRIVGSEMVLADIAGLVERGAEHVTFGDPDFLNGPAHSMRVLRQAHERHPQLTFDVTIKVEHLIRYEDLVGEIGELGVLFVVSAFETVDDRTLRLLAKGHDLADMRQALGIARRAGFDIRPSWMPFTPLTQPSHIVEIFRFMDLYELFDVTDPVQLSIRMLFPKGSLAAEVPEFSEHLGPYDEAALSYPWSSADARSDALQLQVSAIAERSVEGEWSPERAFTEMWAAALDANGNDEMVPQIRMGSTQGRPRLTEPWFC